MVRDIDTTDLRLALLGFGVSWALWARRDCINLHSPMHMTYYLIMANHKRGKMKSSRAGCLLCKPHKVQGNCLHAIKPKYRIEKNIYE